MINEDIQYKIVDPNSSYSVLITLLLTKPSILDLATRLCFLSFAWVLNAIQENSIKSKSLSRLRIYISISLFLYFGYVIFYSFLPFQNFKNLFNLISILFTAIEGFTLFLRLEIITGIKFSFIRGFLPSGLSNLIPEDWNGKSILTKEENKEIEKNK